MPADGFNNHKEQREPIIQCDRIDLHHISAMELLALHDDPAHFEIDRSLGFSNPYRVLVDPPSPVAWRAPQVRQDPQTNKWFIRWMVLRESNEIIGSISFHAPPDSEGMLEIGLGVHEKFRNRGFATEALLGMWKWASLQSGVRTFRYTVDPHNLPSVRVIKRFEFKRVGQQIDEIDGPEDIYELSTAEFMRRWSN